MSQGRILVVDDLPDLRTTICRILEDAGYLARPVATRAEALQLLEQERFHIAVLDVRLDGDEDNRDGLRLTHEIVENYPSTIPIILTGYANVNMVQEALRPDSSGYSPAFSFLQKTEISNLLDWVDQAFKTGLKLIQI